MTISSLSNFSEIKISDLNTHVISQIDLAFRDFENIQSYNSKSSDIKFESIKISSELIPDFYHSHKLKIKILYVVHGILSVQGTSKIKCTPLNYEYQNSELKYFRSEDFFEITNLNKGDIVIIDSNDIYRLISKNNFCKLIIANIN
jgi:hypothetical protein